MLLGTLGASVLRRMLTRSVMTAGKGVLRAGNAAVRAGRGYNLDKDFWFRSILQAIFRLLSISMVFFPKITYLK